MINQTLENWHKRLLLDFSDLGICYSADSIAVNPLELSTHLIAKLSVDLPNLGKLIRKTVLDNFDCTILNVRSDYADVLKLYKDKSRFPIIMRPDGILINNQYKVIEINIDSGIGGIWEMDFLQERFRSNPLLTTRSNFSLPNPKTTFLEFLNEIRRDININGKPNLALVGYSDFNQFYKDQGTDLCEAITNNTDFNAYFHVPELLRAEDDYITDGVRNYHVIYRDGALIHSTAKVAPMLKLTKDACKTKTIFLSDPIDLLIEHKGILATLWETKSNNNNNFTEEELNLIKSYIPWTHFISNKKVLYEKVNISTPIVLTDLLMMYQEEFVIKKCWSHAGEHVYIGQELNRNTWSDLISSIMNQPSEKWVVQENLYSDEVEFDYRQSDNSINKKLQRYTLSPFIFGNNLGGALIRVEHDPSNRVLSLPTNNNMGSAGIIII